MCAIAGVLGIRTDDKICNAMLETMHRRGPDEQGMFTEPNICLLHARLTIIDPNGGKQPMELTHNGQSFILVYNGELYNTEEIRKELIHKGHFFQSHSDTEVVLHAYAQWGAGCLDYLNGIFAFAVWERKTQTLFVARDRIGVKPLFYTLLPQGILFASEIKTILAHPDIRPLLDEQGAAELLLLGPGRLPGSGVFHNIRELEPGCCAFVRDGKLQLQRYWKLRDREHESDFEETAAYVRYLVMDSIQRQMVSDVPIGTFLSGGLDSSIISAVCARQMAEQGKQLDTFSVDYHNNASFFTSNKFQPEMDNHYIRLMTESIESNHHDTVLTTGILVDQLEAATEARDLPGMADVDFSLLAFCSEIRPHVKVALSGECADEIFGGYPWYRDPEIRQKAGFPWAQNTEDRASVLPYALRKKINPEEFVMDAYRTTCQDSDILPGTTPLERRMKEMVNLNFRWFMQTLLDRKDRMSMYHSLEVRVPFCDYRIAEYLYGVPWEFKEYRGQEKGLLRYAMEGILPEPVLYRKKSPYPKTYDPEYEKIIAQKLDTLMQTDAPVFALVNRRGVQELLDKDSPWPWYGQLMRRPQIMAYLLQVEYWLEHYCVDLTF